MDKKRTVKYTALLCAAAVLLSLCLCGCSSDAAVSISEAQLSSGVFAYYVDKVLSYPGQYGLDDNFTRKEAIEKAVGLCQAHIAISSICQQRGFALSAIAKSEVASEVENTFSFFGDYYESIGVTKQDYLLISENAAKRALIIESLYGSKGKTPVSDSELIAAFDKTHVGFKAITGYLTRLREDGAQESYTRAEIQSIYDNFEEMAEKLNDSADIDRLNTDYNESQGLSGPDKLATIVLNESDSTYPDGFYSQVRAIEPGEATVVKTVNYVYVIQRVDISTNNYVNQYRNNILERLKSGDIDRLIEDWCGEHESCKRSGLSGIYKTVAARRKQTQPETASPK